MGHRCGANCRRKLGTRRDCPSCSSATRWLRQPFYAGGQERRMSEHFIRDRTKDRPEVTQSRVTAVLNDWFVRCKTNWEQAGAPPGIVGWSHFGWVDVDGKRKIMQVVTTLDGDIVRTVNLNRNVRKDLQKGEQTWLDRRCLEPPIWRDEK